MSCGTVRKQQATTKRGNVFRLSGVGRWLALHSQRTAKRGVNINTHTTMATKNKSSKAAKVVASNAASVELNNKGAKTATAKARAAGDKAAQAAAKADAKKSAATWGAYRLIKRADNTPCQACKRFYNACMAVGDGEFKVIFDDILGANKNEFAREYAKKVAQELERKGGKNYTLFLVFSVVHKDMKQYTRGNVSGKLKAAFDALRNYVAEEDKK